MDLSLPSSNNTSRSGTPEDPNCERLQAIATDMKKFAIILENIKSMINALRLNGRTDENDRILADNFCEIQLTDIISGSKFIYTDSEYV
ncbi:hypothetical protein TNIN_490031 [Trichonephila inaurata madagascariensis]|uniref:Uncharacterized protein n=1 Tax=Trichonephila inaurata madagascariensis TaxID=2747483 RepID=A0A8X6XIE1_9ARAC|nr:hypothetical protein TNIN_332571 [Trichonephila inaurata madagascariensis]GFY65652.1 hypothetical protein TNIN_490031 [Trichonephila inaurata madagascariensis]